MSAHYSKFSLNVYPNRYFEAHLPPGYPDALILQGARAFRRLPPNLRELAGEAKEWAEANGMPPPPGIEDWYDEEGYELNPDTGERLTDAEIDADWPGWPGPEVPMVDVPRPAGGFPDPSTWQPPVKAVVPDPDDVPSPRQILDDVATLGVARTEEEWGIDLGVSPPLRDPDGGSFDEARVAFAARVERVLGSTYFNDRPREKAVLLHALPSVDLHGDLWGEAESTFDRVEEWEQVKAKLGL